MTTIATIHIPAASLEAGARAIFKVKNPDLEWENCAAQRPRWAQGQRNQARAAFVAMVENWPMWTTGEISAPGGDLPALILPLPQEKPDDKA